MAKKTKSSSFMKNALQPVVDSWNEAVGHEFVIRDSPLEDHIKIESDTQRSMHGSLIHKIAEICDAYHWIFSIEVEDGKPYLFI